MRVEKKFVHNNDVLCIVIQHPLSNLMMEIKSMRLSEHVDVANGAEIYHRILSSVSLNVSQFFISSLIHSFVYQFVIDLILLSAAHPWRLERV